MSNELKALTDLFKYLPPTDSVLAIPIHLQIAPDIGEYKEET